MLGASDFTPLNSPPSLSVLHFTGIFKPIFNNAIQKGKKSKKGFPHLGIKLKTSRTEILAPLKTEQAVYVVMPRSTCFHSRANLVNWFILTGSTVTFEISTTLHHLIVVFFGKLCSALCDFSTFISTAIWVWIKQVPAPLADYKKNIESNFKSLKAGLAPKDKESVPKLPQNQKEW